MPVIPVLGKLRQKIITKEIKDFKFQASSLDSTFRTQQDLCDL